MHTVHLPYDGENKNIKYIGDYFAAAQGILFSVKDADDVDKDVVDIIDNFFDSLKWTEDKTNPTV